MDSKTYDDKVLEMYVNRCIDNIIKHELIEGVTDLKSFADFALQLDLDVLLAGLSRSRNAHMMP